MNMRKMVPHLLAAALFAASGAGMAQEAQSAPSVDSIIESLKTDSTTGEQGQTRALRPGAASMATTAPTSAPDASPAPAPVAKATAKSASVAKSHKATTHKKTAKSASLNMTINFDFNSDQISSSSEQTMTNLTAALSSQQLSDRSFTVVGHTDAKGSNAYNQALSERRAAAVKRYLIDHGVPSGRLSALGKGESQLLDKANPDSGENRRVEIVATGG